MRAPARPVAWLLLPVLAGLLAVGPPAAAAVPQPVPPRAQIPAWSGREPSMAPRVQDTPVTVAQAGPPRAGARPLYSGTSGPVAWEITAIERQMNGDGTMVRWDYELVLREITGVGIQLETLQTGAEGPLHRDTPFKGPFKLRLVPRGQVVLIRNYTIQFASTSTPAFGRDVPSGRAGVRIFLRFEGATEAGTAVRVDVHFSLAPNIGTDTTIRTPPAVTPPASSAIRVGELAALAGSWTGTVRTTNGFTYPTQLVVKADGSFDGSVGTVVKQRVRGAMGLLASGEIEYSTQAARGQAVAHDIEGRRVLVGYARSAANPYSFRLESPVPPPSPMSSAPIAPPLVAPASEPSEILTNQAVLDMVKAGLDEAVILAKISATPARFDTRTDALIELKQAGVPDRVLAAMVGKRPP